MILIAEKMNFELTLKKGSKMVNIDWSKDTNGVTMTIEQATLIKHLRAGADDPMWADHCEMPKRVAKAAADEIERLRAALQKIADIETQLGVPSGLDMQSIANAALAGK